MSINCQATGILSDAEDIVLSHQKVTGGASEQELGGYDRDTEGMTVALQERWVDELCA